MTPRPQEPRCQALDMNGRRCRRLAVGVLRYHGDPELYGFSDRYPGWVRVELCEKHGGDA